MALVAAGRHRAPGHFTPLNEISALIAEMAQPAVKTSAVLAASGGLVAAFAVPAQAAAAAPAPALSKVAASAPAVAGSAPAVLTAAHAPAAAPASIGLAGFTAKAKPKPKPVPVVVASTVVTSTAVTSRSSSSRVSSRSSARQVVAPSYPQKPAATGVLGVASQYVGLMYSYGGTSPSTGFDCSGFTQFVFRQLGISLPRTAEAQRQSVSRVTSPQPGDLVFFGAPAFHVGIYAGNGMMYDSPRSGKAVALRSIWSGSVTYGRP